MLQRFRMVVSTGGSLLHVYRGACANCAKAAGLRTILRGKPRIRINLFAVSVKGLTCRSHQLHLSTNLVNTRCGTVRECIRTRDKSCLEIKKHLLVSAFLVQVL